MEIKLTSHRAQAEEELKSAVLQAMTQIAITANGHAAISCPVDTGRLRASISNEAESNSTGGSASVGTNVEYARYVEYGARGRAGVHYLRNSIADHLDEYKTVIESALKSN